MRLSNSFLVLFFFCFSLFTELQSAELSGKVSVLKKGSSIPLSDFSYSLVYLTGINTVPVSTTVQLNQKNKQFSARVLPIIKGQKVEFWNKDIYQHNVFSTHATQQFDLGRYPKDQFKTVHFNQLGHFKIYCNIHQKMISDIIVLENQYFSLTDNKGHYQINNIPAGNYQLHVWNIYGGEAQQDIVFNVYNRT